MSIEKMTYQEAASYLGVRVDSLKHAIQRGALTPLPRQGLVRYLPAEQVRLFKNKALALSVLTKEEGEAWTRIAEQTGAIQTRPTILPYLTEEEGLEQGERFGKNWKRGVYRGIQERDPEVERELTSPLAS